MTTGEPPDIPTALYDELSSALRDGDLQRAEAEFTALDDTLRSGGRLPEPWRVADAEGAEHGA